MMTNSAGRTSVRRWSVAGVVLGCWLLASACTTNQTTGRSQFLSMSREEEIKLGTEAAPGLTQEFGGAVQEPALQAYVRDIGNRLAQQTEADNPTLPWEFTLLDSDVINAFALPGGKVFISRGLAAEMTNEAQMAAVLGHEIGHVTARHSNERFGQSIGSAIGGAVIGGLIGAAAGGRNGALIGAGAGAGVGGVVSLSFSRDQEIEADRLGMRYMERLKYNPVGALQVQEILGRESAKGGSGRPPEFLSTHPTSETRIRALQARLDKYYRHTVNNPEYSFHEARFQNQFLRRLAALEPSVHGRRGELLLAAALGDPVLWCAHCREAAATAGGR